MNDIISVVIPCYNEEESIPLFYNEINKELKDINNIDYELLFINDGSTDKTLDNIKKISKKDIKVRYISFSRNFGKEAAIYAGLEHSKGDYVVVMDCDLQDPPSLLKTMYKEIKENKYDSIATRRINRIGEPLIRSFCAKLFYKVINKISKANIVDGARDYRLMTRQMVNSIIEMREYNRFSKGIFGWVGFETKWLEYENIERSKGISKWSFIKLFIYSIEGIVAFSTLPLVIASLFGMLFILVAFILIIFIVIRTLIYGDLTSGWPSLACIIFFVSGIQLFSTGIIGQYLAKTYLETKKRPIYIIKETNNNL